MIFKFSKGLDLPIIGSPDQRIDTGRPASKKVAVLGSDYIGLKPTMLVKVGDKVKLGQPLFEDKKTPGVQITSPAAGVVTEINRGEKRALISVVVEREGKARVKCNDFEASELSTVGEKKVRSNLLKSGLWVSFRTRPFNKTPQVDDKPDAIFVNAMDTNPLAADPSVVIAQDKEAFSNGLDVLNNFGVKVYLCKSLNSDIPTPKTAEVAEFSGPHPAGNSSTHIHSLRPVNANRTVWTINYQDVTAIGNLFTTGYLDTTRVIALAGPKISSPRLVKVDLGTDIEELLMGATKEGDKRVISGSVLSGNEAVGVSGYLGRYHNQVSVIDEDRERHLFGWIVPGANKHSKINVFISSLFGKNKKFNLTSSQNGSPRAVVPIGVYEKVMPLDILPTPLLKAILVKDTDTVQQLGGLELVEEDLALCTYVDPGKHDFGPVLRENLTQIELEG